MTAPMPPTDSRRKHMDMTFEQYVAAINALAAKDKAFQADGTYCDAEAWRGPYEDGDTPEYAWAEEKMNWQE